MEKRANIFLSIILICIVYGCKQENDGWKLTWEENFDNDGVIDEQVWSKIPRGKSDWNNYMSDNDELYDVREGNLILTGMANPDFSVDSVPYITGGIYTKGKKAFGNGKIEIKAKIGDAQGAWPAFWLLPFDDSKWPDGGEIDIMERLNADTIAYQTVHSHYTFDLGNEDNPPHGGIGRINRGEYNVYSVELHPDSVVFAINGVHTLTYPRIETDKEGQFPFDKDFYLLLDMQLEGKWVGKANPEDLPVSMQIDWVRFYEKENN